MNKLEFISNGCLCGLKCNLTGLYTIDYTKNEKIDYITVDIIGTSRNDIEIYEKERQLSTYYNIDSVMPIVRSLDCLFKPIIQSDYNNGKPFIPVTELTHLYPNFNFVHFPIVDMICIDNLYYQGNTNIIEYFNIIKQLIKWHFDLITEKCEKVYVTDDYNPYK